MKSASNLLVTNIWDINSQSDQSKKKRQEDIIEPTDDEKEIKIKDNKGNKNINDSNENLKIGNKKDGQNKIKKDNLKILIE